MGLSVLDCSECGGWDEKQEYLPGEFHAKPPYEADRPDLEMPNGRIIHGHNICGKCFERLKKEGGKPFRMKPEYKKVYEND